MMRSTLLILSLSVAAFTLGFGRAEAASITFSNQTFSGGSGWGNVLSIMGLQQAPRATSESGEVLWDGSADDVLDDATNQSQTRTVAELIAGGISSTDAEFGVVFNINDTTGNKTVTLSALAVNFFDAAGSLLFSAPYVCNLCAYPFPLLLDEESQGLGNSGFLFRVALTDAERAQLFGSTTNRVGMSATVLDTDNGPEQFYLADLYPTIDEELEHPAVPEPATLMLLGSGLAFIGWRRMRSRR